MIDLVIDASVAIKWVLPERDTAAALGLKSRSLAAPDLLTAECANILWKHVRRGELSAAEAHAAAETLLGAKVELFTMHSLFDDALAWAVTLGHPAYDCFYLALAERLAVPLVTADGRLERMMILAGQSRVEVRRLDPAH